MLARRLATIPPAMSLAEALETTRIHSVAGLTSGRTAVVTTRPFRAPHHTISDVGLIGGGQLPMLGEVSLAHHGLLLVDELQSSSVMASKSCDNLSSLASQEYNGACVIDLAALATGAARMTMPIGPHATGLDVETRGMATAT